MHLTTIFSHIDYHLNSTRISGHFRCLLHLLFSLHSGPMAKLPVSLFYPKLIKSLILHPQFSHSRCPFSAEAENSVWKQCWLFWKNNYLHIGYPGGKGFVMFWEKDRGIMKRRECQPTFPPGCGDYSHLLTGKASTDVTFDHISFLQIIHVPFEVNTHELHVCKSVF